MKPLAVIFLAGVNVFAVLYAPQPLLPLFASEFQVSVATASLTISLTIMALAGASLLLAPFSDRFDRKKGIVLASALFIIPTLLLLFATSFSWLLVLRTLQGIFIPGMTALLLSYVSEEFPAEERGRLMGAYVAATVAGGLIGRIISGLVAEYISWHAVFAVWLVFSITVTLLLWRYLPRPRNQASVSERGFLQHFTNPALLGTFFIGFSQFFAFISIFTYLPFYASQPPFSLSVGELSLLYVTFSLGVLAAPLSGFVSDRIGRRKTMAIGHLIGAAGILCTLWQTIPGLLVGLSILSFGNFTSQSAATAFVGDCAASSRGAANALYQFFFYVGGSLGAWLPGLFWSTYGWHGTVVMTEVSILIALLVNQLVAGRTSFNSASGSSALN